MNKKQNWFNILMIILQNFTKKNRILKLVLCDWIECEYSEFTNQSSFQNNSDSSNDCVKKTWLISKVKHIWFDIMNYLMTENCEHQQLQSLQYWVWIFDLWTFYHLFWDKCLLTIILIHRQKCCQKKTNSNFETVWNITMNEANMTIVNELFLNKNIIAVIETMKQKWT